MDQDGRRTWLGLGAIILLAWMHAAWIMARGAGTGEVVLPVLFLGATCAAVSLASMTALAAGIEGYRPLVLVPALLTASSPLFAGSLFGGGYESLITTLFLLGAQRAFSETHVPGQFPLSAVFIALGAALGPGGLAVLLAVAAQKMVFVRKFRLGRANWIFTGVWLLVGLVAWSIVRFGLGIAPAGGPPPAGLWAAGREFWRQVDGLASLPLVLILAVGWKSKAVTFRLSLAVFILAGCILAAATTRGLPWTLVPAMPFAFLVVGEALTAVIGLGETAGLRGRARTLMAAALAAAFALGQLWPTLATFG